MVSPRARPKPSTVALMTPDLPKGSTAIRIISQRVAPSARAASRCVCGTCRNTSREMAAMIGRIITPSTSDAAKMDFPKPPSVPKIGIQPKYRVIHFDNGIR